MSVLVDSPIWSLAFRRKTVTTPEARALSDLISRNEASIIGAVRQEVLSGVRSAEQFARLQSLLAPFPDIPVSETHYERAAEFHNTCRTHGVQGSPTDFLICAVAAAFDVAVFTTDRDFNRFATLLPVKLHSIR